MPVVSIRHSTLYRYRKPVGFGEHRMMFAPREGAGRTLVSRELTIGPMAHQLRRSHDAFGNVVEVARFTGRSRELSFVNTMVVAHDPAAPFADLDPDAAEWVGAEPFAYDAEEAPDLAPSIARAHQDADGAIADWARRFVRPVGKTSLPRLLTDMCHAIRADLSYGKRLEKGLQTPAETLERRSGACRDYALLMMEAARSLGVAARFSSGYLYSLRGAREHVGGGHTHGWASLYVPGCGWTAFDPTNGLVGSAGLIETAQVRDPVQATVLHGSWAGFAGDYLGMDVEVRTDAVEAEQPSAATAVALSH